MVNGIEKESTGAIFSAFPARPSYVVELGLVLHSQEFSKAPKAHLVSFYGYEEVAFLINVME